MKSLDIRSGIFFVIQDNNCMNQNSSPPKEGNITIPHYYFMDNTNFFSFI